MNEKDYILVTVMEAWALDVARSRATFARAVDRLEEAGVHVERSPAVVGVLERIVVGEEAKRARAQMEVTTQSDQSVPDPAA